MTATEHPSGSLRIYLGAAPGVGKTYAMLNEGHRRAERGADVVVGFAEPHARQHTIALLDGLEVVPRRTLEYRGATFEEMDVDAVLARHDVKAMGTPARSGGTGPPSRTPGTRAARGA